MLGMMMTMIFAFGVTLMVREFRHSAQENKHRAARRALHAKPRVIDIDPKEERKSNRARATTNGNFLPITTTLSKADS